MKFSELENIWVSDLSGLSNKDKARVYVERARIVIAEAMANPAQRARAVEGARFRRDYLIERIGCTPAVSVQNPGVRKLLQAADHALANEVASSRRLKHSSATQAPRLDSAEVRDLRARLAAAQRRIEMLEAEVRDLCGTLREARRAEIKRPNHGRLPC